MSAQKHLGIEITDRQVKYLALSEKGKSFILGPYGTAILPEGIIEEGSIRQGLRLTNILEAIRKKCHCSDATVSHLPDQVFLADIFRAAGYKNVYFESSGEALARILIPKGSKETAMIIYFTGANMEIYAGDRSSARLLATFILDKTLLEKPMDREIIFSFLKEKIDEQYISWHTHKDDGKKREKIEKVILAGEISAPEEMAEYLGRHLKLRVDPAESWQNLVSFESQIPEMDFAESLRYAAVLGLASRPFEK